MSKEKVTKEKKPMTKKDVVLKYLRTHKKGLTKAQAEEKLGITNLNSVILTIRRSGIEVSCEKVVKKNGETQFVYKLV